MSGPTPSVSPELGLPTPAPPTGPHHAENDP